MNFIGNTSLIQMMEFLKLEGKCANDSEMIERPCQFLPSHTRSMAILTCKQMNFANIHVFLSFQGPD